MRRLRRWCPESPPWAKWWIPTLKVMNELGGGDEASRREVEVMTEALADPTVWLTGELLHACWGRAGKAA